MTIRRIAILVAVAVAVTLGGCVVGPRHYSERRVHHYDSDYRTTESYQGYYYVRVIYVEGAPWYVDDDGRARPVPPHLRERFLAAPQVRSAPPGFSRDTTVRYGYPVSRIVYINNEPYHVDDERRVHPLPSHLRSRFPYVPPVAPRPDNDWEEEERPMPPFLNGNTGSRAAPPAYGGEQPRPLPPAWGRDKSLPVPPAYGRDQQQPVPPAYGQDQQQPAPPAWGRDQEQPTPPAWGRDQQQPAPPTDDDDQQKSPPPANGRDGQVGEPPAGRRNNGEKKRYAAQDNGRDKADAPRASATSRARNGNGRAKEASPPGANESPAPPASDSAPSAEPVADATPQQEKRRGKKKPADASDEDDGDSADNKKNGRDR